MHTLISEFTVWQEYCQLHVIKLKKKIDRKKFAHTWLYTFNTEYTYMHMHCNDCLIMTCCFQLID